MKKNKINIGTMNKMINNNQKKCLVDENTIINKEDNLSIKEKLDKLLKNNGYLFSSNVKIITNKKEYLTSIAVVTSDHIITIDNDIIYLTDIKDLIIM